MPQLTLVLQEPATAGRALPADVIVTPVQETPHHGYVSVGRLRVIVEPQTRKVVQDIR